MDMEVKRCFKCGRVLPLSDFYPHRGMKDGHLNKCKECTKNDVKIRYFCNSQNPEYMEKERVRSREKYSRYAYKKTKRGVKKAKAFGGLRGARKFWERRGYVFPAGVELHHWNYNNIHEVIVMPRILHHRLHSVIHLKDGEGIYYNGTERLDTIEKHLSVLNNVCAAFGFNQSEIKVLKTSCR